VNKARLSWLPWLPILVAPILLFAPLLFTGKVLYWGTPALQFIPWQYAAVEAIRSGELPLWNPWVGMGAPLAANYQSALFYPPNWISLGLGLVGGITWMARGQTLLVVLHLVWAGLGIARLARRLGLGVLAQTLAGLAYGLSGYLVARSGFLSINATAAWLPWVLLGAEGLVTNPGYRNYCITSVSVALQLLAGHAQTAWYSLILAVMWVIYRGWNAHSHKAPIEVRLNNSIENGEKINSRTRLSHALAALARLTAAYCLGVCLAAVQLIPTAEYLLQSQRASAVDFSIAMTYSFWPWRFLGLLAPGLFGSPVTGDYWGYGNYWEDAIYIGLLPVLLALGSLLSMFGRLIARKRAADSKKDDEVFRLLPFLAAITILSFILALGKNTPVFAWLYRFVPTFNMFQAPTRFSLWAVFALVLLAAIGAERLKHPEKRALYWTRLGTAGAFAVTLGAGLTWYFLPGIQPTMIRAVALSGLWSLGGGLLALTAPPADRSQCYPLPAWYAVVIIWIMADLLVANWGLNPGIDADFFNHSLPMTVNLQSGGEGQRIYISSEDESELKYKRYFIFKSFDPGLPWEDLRAIRLPNMNILDRVPSANNFDPLLSGRYARWLEVVNKAKPGLASRLLNLMGVGVVEKLDSVSSYGVRYQMIPGSQRFRFVPCAYYAQNESEALANVIDLKIDLAKYVVIEGLMLADKSLCPDAQTSADIQLISDRSNSLQVNLKVGEEGFLVVSDVWYPGWKALVDGKAVPVWRGNYLFRVVPVSAGAHTVEMIYRPASFMAGLALTLLAILGLGLVYWVGGKRHAGIG
jgi:hypothetical protein